MTRGPQKQFDRDQVLERAMEVFWASGYDGSGMAALLEHMGIGRQSLYDTFGGKKQLFAEALHHYFRSRVLPIVMMVKAPGSPTANLQKVFDHWLTLSREEGPRGCLVGKTMAELGEGKDDQGLRELVGGYVSTLKEAYTDLFRRGQEMGEFTRRLSPEELANVFICMNQGAALMSKLVTDPAEAKAMLDATLALLKAEDG